MGLTPDRRAVRICWPPDEDPRRARESLRAEPAAKTVLVVDDEKNIRRTLQLALEGEGYKVVSAENAETGLEILASPEDGT